MDALSKLAVWQRACRFSVDIYGLSSICRNQAFVDQLGRSALSVASNIAEGYERGSDKEFARFLRIAKGSVAEAWTQLLIGKEAGLIDSAISLELADEAKQIAKMLFGLIKYLEEKNQQT
ncbi:MAG: four helix bundle protein [Gammaproteobacteria bacterium]|nr:four helix bundle protein [Gammaproteobacteria bacterium]